MPKPDDGASLRRLNALSDEATQEYFRRSSIKYLECAVALMLTSMTIEQVADVLRDQADMLEDLG